jgi:nucleoprotein TPR
MECAHLSDFMSNVQKIHNDLELSGENDRHRLENQLQSNRLLKARQVQSSDVTLSVKRVQLVQERDTIRYINL